MPVRLTLSTSTGGAVACTVTASSHAEASSSHAEASSSHAEERPAAHKKPRTKADLRAHKAAEAEAAAAAEVSTAASAAESSVPEAAPPSATSSGATTAGRRAKTAPPQLGQLFYGTPNVRTLSNKLEDLLRGDFELGVHFRTGSKSLGDGDVHEILWMQRVLGHDGEERNRFQPTNERWPGSKAWGRLAVLGTASLDEARVDQWIDDESCHFSRADAESLVRQAHGLLVTESAKRQPKRNWADGEGLSLSLMHAITKRQPKRQPEDEDEASAADGSLAPGPAKRKKSAQPPATLADGAGPSGIIIASAGVAPFAAMDDVEEADHIADAIAAAATCCTIGAGVEVRPSSITGGGLGLFATRRFSSRERITMYDGKWLPGGKEEASWLAEQSHVASRGGIYWDGWPLAQAAQADPASVKGRGGGAFANHVKNYNAEMELNQPPPAANCIFLHVRRQHVIEAGDEIFITYGTSELSRKKGSCAVAMGQERLGPSRASVGTGVFGISGSRNSNVTVGDGFDKGDSVEAVCKNGCWAAATVVSRQRDGKLPGSAREARWKAKVRYQQVCHPPSPGRVHVAKEDETPDSLARKFSLPAVGIIALNKGDPELSGLTRTSRLRDGTVVRLPQVVIASEGDTPARLAEQYGLDAAELAERQVARRELLPTSILGAGMPVLFPPCYPLLPSRRRLPPQPADIVEIKIRYADDSPLGWVLASEQSWQDGEEVWVEADVGQLEATTFQARRRGDDAGSGTWVELSDEGSSWRREPLLERWTPRPGDALLVETDSPTGKEWRPAEVRGLVGGSSCFRACIDGDEEWVEAYDLDKEGEEWLRLEACSPRIPKHEKLPVPVASDDQPQLRLPPPPTPDGFLASLELSLPVDVFRSGYWERGSLLEPVDSNGRVRVQTEAEGEVVLCNAATRVRPAWELDKNGCWTQLQPPSEAEMAPGMQPATSGGDGGEQPTVSRFQSLLPRLHRDAAKARGPKPPPPVTEEVLVDVEMDDGAAQPEPRPADRHSPTSSSGGWGSGGALSPDLDGAPEVASGINTEVEDSDAAEDNDDDGQEEVTGRGGGGKRGASSTALVVRPGTPEELEGDEETKVVPVAAASEQELKGAEEVLVERFCPKGAAATHHRDLIRCLLYRKLPPTRRELQNFNSARAGGSLINSASEELEHLHLALSMRGGRVIGAACVSIVKQSRRIARTCGVELILFAVSTCFERRGVGSRLFELVRGWAAEQAANLYVLSAESHIEHESWWLRTLRRAGMAKDWAAYCTQSALRDSGIGSDAALPRGFWLPWDVCERGSGIRTVLAVDASKLVEEAHEGGARRRQQAAEAAARGAAHHREGGAAMMRGARRDDDEAEAAGAPQNAADRRKRPRADSSDAPAAVLGNRGRGAGGRGAARRRGAASGEAGSSSAPPPPPPAAVAAEVVDLSRAQTGSFAAHWRAYLAANPEAASAPSDATVPRFLQWLEDGMAPGGSSDAPLEL